MKRKLSIEVKKMSDTFDQQLRQIIPIAERWKELQAERNSIAMEGAKIVRRMDELRPLCRIEAEFESAQKALKEIIALPEDKLKHQHYAEIDRQEKRVQQMQAIETELHQVDQTLNKNEARLDAIDKEIAPLNEQLDQFGALLSKHRLIHDHSEDRDYLCGRAVHCGDRLRAFLGGKWEWVRYEMFGDTKRGYLIGPEGRIIQIDGREVLRWPESWEE